MEGMVSIVGFGDDNAMAKLEERTGLELQEDPHKQTADVLSGELGLGFLNFSLFFGELDV
jgi:hypothetical protein